MITDEERIESRLSHVESRLDGVEGRLGSVENRLNSVEAKLGGVQHDIKHVLSALLAANVNIEGLEEEMENRFDRMETAMLLLSSRITGMEADDLIAEWERRMQESNDT